MKRILSVALALLMILATCTVFVSADGTTCRELQSGEKPTSGTRVASYGTPTIDGELDTEVYKTYSKISSDYKLNASMEYASFTAYYANDGEYFYFWINTVLPESKSALDDEDLVRLYIDFYNQHTQIYGKESNEYQNTYLGTSVTEYNGGQFQYKINSKTVSVSRCGNDGKTAAGSEANGDFKVVVHYSDTAGKDVSDYNLEGRIKLPTYIKDSIANNKQPIIGVGYEIRSNLAPKYKIGYGDEEQLTAQGKTMDVLKYAWADYTVAPDVVLSNASESNVTDFGFTVAEVADVTGKTVTLDGVKDDSEGWNAFPFLLLNRNYDGSAVTEETVANPSKLWIASDKEYIYLYFETVNTDWIWTYFILSFGGDEVSATDDKLFVEFRGGINADDIRVKNKNGAYSAGNAFFDKTAYVRKSENGIATQEVKIPIPESVSTARVKGTFDMKISVLERKASSSNAGLANEAGFGWNAGTIPMTISKIDDPEAENLPNWIEESKTTAYYDSLKNITVNAYGDSYLKGNGLNSNYIWASMLSTKYGWTYSNYAENGKRVSGYNYTETTNIPMYKGYKSMTNNKPNLVILDGGRNDYNNNVPIGTIDDEDSNTFMGSLNILFKGLRKKYADAALVYLTVWNFPNTNKESTLTYLDYAQATEKVCEKWGVYCFKAYDPAVSGVDMTSETFRAQYCMTASDISHLNLSGMKLVMPTIETYLNQCMTDWATNKDAILAKVAENTGKEAETEPETDAGKGEDESATTAKPADTQKPADSTESKPKDKGCKSALGSEILTAMLLVTTAVALVSLIRRKKKSF